MKISLAKAIYSLKSDAQFTIYDNNFDNIVWYDDNPTNITKEQVTNEQTRLQSLEDARPENVLKNSAKQKLMNGEALTEDEANLILGL